MVEHRRGHRSEADRHIPVLHRPPPPLSAQQPPQRGQVHTHIGMFASVATRTARVHSAGRGQSSSILSGIGCLSAVRLCCREVRCRHVDPLRGR